MVAKEFWKGDSVSFFFLLAVSNPNFNSLFYLSFLFYSCSSSACCNTEVRATHTFFRKLGHQSKVQILDNEASDSLLTYFETQHIAYQPVPPNQKRANAAERSIQTFRRQFISLLATTHPSFPINHWPALLFQAELTLNLQRPSADLPSISTYNGIYREPYDFLVHPIAPCGTLIVLHNTRRETWDNFGLIGFYLGPARAHYRSYNCLVSDSDSYRVCDNIILYPAPLVLPGASRFDQLLALTDSPPNTTHRTIRPNSLCASGHSTNFLLLTLQRKTLPLLVYNYLHLWSSPPRYHPSPQLSPSRSLHDTDLVPTPALI
jgi:hypothetical protein